MCKKKVYNEKRKPKKNQIKMKLYFTACCNHVTHAMFDMGRKAILMASLFWIHYKTQTLFDCQ